MEERYVVGGSIVTLIMLLSMGYVYYGDTELEPTHICTGDKEIAHCYRVTESAKTCYISFNETTQKAYQGKRCGSGVWEQLIVYENTPERPEIISDTQCTLYYDRCVK